MEIPLAVVRKSGGWSQPDLTPDLAGVARRPRRPVWRTAQDWYPDRTTGSVESVAGDPHDRAMKKRVFAAFLWFYTGWYAGALIAEFLGLSPFLGPIIGTASAALFVGDPRRIIWTARAIAPKASETAPEPA
jgi:hypothetical protein